MSRRMIANFAAFLVLSAALVAYGVVNLLGNPFSHPTVVSATFPNASGVEPNFGVVLQGVVVGSVDGVQLTSKGARVLIAIRPGVQVPANVQASIGLANDLGEQQVQLAPEGRPDSHYLRNGATIPVEANGVPIQVGQVIDTASRLLRSVGASQLNSVLSSLAQGLQGQAENLQLIMSSSQQFSSEFLAYQSQFEALLANSAPVLNGLAADGGQLRQDLASTAVLAQVLDQHRYNLVHLLANGASATSIATKLLDATRPNLACILHDFADVSANAAEPTNLSNLSVGLATNQWFFGAVEGITPTGPAASLFAGDEYDNNQEWIRTRLLIPPSSPPANEYAKTTGLNPVLPGAACDTEFGRGVPAVSQTAAQFPVSGTHVDPPTAADSVVRGGADPSSARTEASRSGARLPASVLSSDAVPASGMSGYELLLLVGAALGLAILIPRRCRSARRLDRKGPS